MALLVVDGQRLAVGGCHLAGTTYARSSPWCLCSAFQAVGTGLQIEQSAVQSMVGILALAELLAACVVYEPAREYAVVLGCNSDFHNRVCGPDRSCDGWLGGHLPSGA